jgi:hypothetical protein
MIGHRHLLVEEGDETSSPEEHHAQASSFLEEIENHKSETAMNFGLKKGGEIASKKNRNFQYHYFF